MGEAQRRPRGVRTGGVGSGEIVEVQGGHIVRATGRKDRHSKVCTAKGLRDRRVRLSAHTAIQFYDVQDRLGYDRPSKAVDWLIKNAKPAIDQLAQLPPWRPPDPLTDPAEGEKPLPSAETDEYGSSYGFREGSSFLPPPLDSDSIADTIKFPMTATSSSSNAYPSASDLLSHGGGHAGDLRLSLHSVQDPIFHHQHNRVASLAFEAGGSAWLDPGQRATAWNLAEPVASATAAAAVGGGGSSGGYLLGVPPQLVQNQFLTQWGPLQSSNPPSIRAWADPAALATAYGNQMPLSALRSSSSSPLPVIITASGDVVGFSGLHIPARIQGGEEEHGCADALPSASSASHR